MPTCLAEQALQPTPLSGIEEKEKEGEEGGDGWIGKIYRYGVGRHVPIGLEPQVWPLESVNNLRATSLALRNGQQA